MFHPQISIQKIFAFIFLTSFLCISCSKEEDIPTDPTNYSATPTDVFFEKDAFYESQILIEMNNYLTALNLNELQINPDANQVAFEHTKQLIESNALHHENFSERQAYFNSLGFVAVRENVAMGFNNATDLLNAWLQSSSHREAVESNSTHTGISVLKNENGVYFITQIYLK